MFYSPREKQTVHDQAEMNRHLNPAVDRFKAAAPAEQDAFREALGTYVRLYAFLSQIMPFSDPDLEKLYGFARFLETKLPQAYHDQVITGADVSEYLETKVSFLPKIEKALARRLAKVGQGR